MEASPRTLVIGVGNVLRRDDGAGARVLELLAGQPGLELLETHGFTPELAAAMAGRQRVYLVDADARAVVVTLERLERQERGSTLGHDLGPGGVVKLARRLYGFAGEAWLCRLPVQDLGFGEGLGAAAEQQARLAAQRLSVHVRRRPEPAPAA